MTPEERHKATIKFLLDLCEAQHKFTPSNQARGIKHYRISEDHFTKAKLLIGEYAKFECKCDM